MRVTLAIIAVALVVFAAQMLTGMENGIVTNTLSLVPNQFLSGALWQPFTYMWLHGDIMHIAINMFVFAIFANVVETTLGPKKFILLYILAGLGSAGLYMLLTGPSDILMLGASGSVFGVLAAYGMLYPKNIIIMFPGIPMPAIAAVVIFAGVELFFGVSGLEPGIANFGHLGGLIVGVALVLWWKRAIKRQRLAKDFQFYWE